MSGKTVVITGSTKGIGKGLAREFARRGHNVVVSGRSGLDAAVAEVQAIAAAGAKVVGQTCDVTDLAQVQALWARAVDSFGRVDIWINNAGLSNTRFPIGKLPQAEVEAVIRANLLGTMFGSRVALAGMQSQGSGALYNFEGFGSNGRRQRGISLYGATKNAITYFNKCLERETKGGPVLVGLMSPGIVITDLSLRDKGKMPPQAWDFVIKVFNILADRVETVTPWLADQALANTRHGARIAWLTPRKSLWRFLKSRISPPGERFPELRAST
ncbi:MAG: SDR family oxidoreductase [Rhodospirillaceae bacterium]|nr:SDR family oxidoreductase [Rhodospirillaceae bacterium]